MSEVRLTDEQAQVCDASAAGRNLVVEAAAGSGKTFTVREAAKRMRYRPARLKRELRGRYLAYNSAAAKAARATFPDHVRCSTIHSLAWSIGAQYAERHRVPLPGAGGAPRQPGSAVAKILRITSPLACDQVVVKPAQLGRVVMETLDRYCQGIDPELTTAHVPAQLGLTKAGNDYLATQLLPLAARAWDDVRDLYRGQLNCQHDYYLRMWWDSGRARIGSDWLVLDEAQDANPLALAILLRQTHAQLIAVGDRYQRLYAFRGCTDAMSAWPTRTRLQLSQSFRFGPRIAEQANYWLALLGADLRVRGTPSIDSRVALLTEPSAVLCRTNAGAMAQALAALEAGRKPALASGTAAIRAFCQAAAMLQGGQQVAHPDLFAFASWTDVQDHVAEGNSGDLAVLVRLVDTWGAEALIAAIEQMVPPELADVVLSTGHGAKGLEFGSVRIHDDFMSPGYDGHGRHRPLPEDLGMLCYVAVTRAQHVLDPSGVGWVQEWLSAFLPHAPSVSRPA